MSPKTRGEITAWSRETFLDVIDIVKGSQNDLNVPINNAVVENALQDFKNCVEVQLNDTKGLNEALDHLYRERGAFDVTFGGWDRMDNIGILCHTKVTKTILSVLWICDRLAKASDLKGNVVDQFRSNEATEQNGTISGSLKNGRDEKLTTNSTNNYKELPVDMDEDRVTERALRNCQSPSDEKITNQPDNIVVDGGTQANPKDQEQEDAEDDDWIDVKEYPSYNELTSLKPLGAKAIPGKQSCGWLSWW